MSDEATIHIDGAARGNPGPSSFAFVIARTGLPPVEACERLGQTTNNVAEYTALVRALRRAVELGLRRLQVYSDSELMVKQMNGEYRVKSEDLKPLFEEAQDLVESFDVVQIRHVRREQNKRADELCNLALDGGSLTAAPAAPAAPTRSAATKSARGAVGDERVRKEAIACLQASLQSARTNPDREPDAVLLWEQLWSLLDEAGVLKKVKK